MKKKIILFGAALAALATFTGCSSEGDPILDTPVEPIEPVVKGTPFKVRIGDGTTRADFSKTTTTGLSTFVLYGIQQTTNEFWMGGLRFTKSGDDWSASEYKNDAWSSITPTWPLTNKETATNFYGFSDGVTDGIPEGLNPSISPTSQSFTFDFGDGTTSAPYAATMSPYQVSLLPEVAQAGLNSTRETSKQSTSADVLESDKLVDLLVTKDGTTGVEGTDGTLTLGFKHALSNLVVKAYFVGDEAGTTWPSTSVFYIEWIRIYGLYTSGTYTFGSGWTFGNSEKKVIYEKLFGEQESATVDKRFSMPVQTYADYQQNGVHYETLVDAGEFMVIPQDYSTRAYAGQGTAIANAAGQVYIEIHGYFKLNPDATEQGRGAKSYFTLDVKDNLIVSGKKQTVIINLTKMLNSNGQYFLTPSTVVGA